MSTAPNSWFIVKTAYDEPTELNYTLGNGTAGQYVVQSANTLIILPDGSFSTTGINANDIIVLDIPNIESYITASNCIKRINVNVNVVLFVDGGSYGSLGFSLTNFSNILSFKIRVKSNSESTPVPIDLNKCSNLKSIDIDRFKLTKLDASVCSSLSGNLDLQYCSITSISTVNCKNLTGIIFPSSSVIESLNLGNCSSITEIIELSKTNFSTLPIINLSGTNINIININSLDLTNIAYPESMRELSITASTYNSVLDLKNYTSLTSLTLNSCGNLTGFEISSSVKTLNLNSCTNLNEIYNIPSNLTYCSIISCNFAVITSNGFIQDLILKSLPNCAAIDLLNTSTSNIRIGGDDAGIFVIDKDNFPLLEHLAIPALDITSISLSSTAENSVFKSLDINQSMCESITIPFGKFTGIQNLNFGNCTKLNKFNNSNDFTAADISSLTIVDLTNTKFTTVDVHGSSSIADIYFPSGVTKIDMQGLVNISDFSMSNYQQLEYLDISNTGIILLSGDYASKPTSEIEIYATHESFSSLTLSNGNIKTIEFNTSGFSNINCASCSFAGNTLDLSTYSGLTDITLTNCGLNTLSINGNATKLDASGNLFTSISVDNLQSSSLSTINLANCSKFNGFNNTGEISGLPNTITSLNLGGTNTTEIEYNGESNTGFTELILPNTMQIINLSNCQYLNSSIDPADMNSLEIFNTPNCNQSTSIEFNSTNLREIDISNNNISSISFTSTPTIESLNLENTKITGNFENGTYNINLSKLSTLKLAGTNITRISIPYSENVIGIIENFSLPSDCTSLNISDQDSINNLSTILKNGTNLVILFARNCNIEGTLEINSQSLSVVSLYNNPDLSTFDLSNYHNLTSFDLGETSITDISINSDSTITTATHSTSTENIIFTKAFFSEALQNLSFYIGDSPNLKSLSLINTNISNLTCSNCPKLSSIILTPSSTKSREIIENNSLANLTIDNCESLPSLQINNCTALTTASISSCQILESLYLNNCPILNSLSVNSLTKLSTLELIDCNIFAGNSLFNTDLMSTLPNLVTLKLTNTRVQQTIINNSSTFTTLTGSLKGTNADGDTIGISTLNLNGCTNFAGITDDSGSTISFASAIPYAESINVGNTNISNINCSGLSSLTTLILPSVATQLNIANCASLNEIDISNCVNLEQLNASSSGIENITTSNIEQTKLKDINMSSTNITEIDLNSYTSLEIVDLENTKITSYNAFPSTLETLLLDNTLINILKIPRLENLSELSLKNLNLSILRIDGCINLSNDYLRDVSILDSAEFINLGSLWPNSIQYIKPKSLIISNTNWSTFSLNGELLNDPETSIDIKANNKLSTLSFLNIPDRKSVV